MSNTASIERAESGPAWADRSSEQFDGYSTERTERQLYDDFQKSVDGGDANALCAWAPRVVDWNAINRLPIEQRTPQTRAAARRAPTLAECMAESLDYGDGPSMTEAMQLIVNVATGCDESTTAQARRLLERMADSFARHNS